MLPVYHLQDAVFAERVPALRDVRIIECLKAYNALSELTDDVVDANFYRLRVPRILLNKAWLLLWQIVIVYGLYHLKFALNFFVCLFTIFVGRMNL